MSKEEFDAQDEEVLAMANRVPNKKTSGPENCNHGANCGQTESAGCTEAYKRRQILWTVLQVACCILIAALLVAAMRDPSIVVHLVNVGVLVCGMAVAVLVDRTIQLWKRR